MSQPAAGARAVAVLRLRRPHPRAARLLRLLLVSCVGVVAAFTALATVVSVAHPVGPVDVRLSVRPSLHGGTEVDVPPLGQLALRTHQGPLQLRARVTGIRLAAAREALAQGASSDSLAEGATRDVRAGVERLLVRGSVVALLAAALACLMLFRRLSAAAVGAGATAVVLLLSLATAAATVRPRALTEPTYTGLLAQAPALIGSARDIDARFNTYRRQLTAVVTNVTELYNTLSTLSDASFPDDIRVLWVSDIHDNPEAFDVMRSLISQFKVTAVVDTGDLSDHGLAAENQLYGAIGGLGVPYIYVRGNHDSTGATQAYVAKLPNVTVLDGRTADIAGLRWAGMGDPLFTPDKSAKSGPGKDTDFLHDFGNKLVGVIDASPTPVDVALVHDPTMAEPLFGHVPLVLDGHVHHRAHANRDSTLELTQGSSGGAGLRNLEGETPLDLEMSILHFDPTTHALLAVDDITLGGLGERSIRVQRHAASSYAPDPGATPSSVPSASG